MTINAFSLPSEIHCGYSQWLVKAKILTDIIFMPRECFLSLPDTYPGILILPVFAG